MTPLRLCAALALAGASLGLASCETYDGYGYYGYDSGYSRSYGYPYYGRPYYGWPYYGWYDDYYYPGTGSYIYDRAGRRHHWDDQHRRHWQSRREHLREQQGDDGRRDEWRRHEGRRDEWRGDGWRRDRREILQNYRQYQGREAGGARDHAQGQQQNWQDYQAGRLNRQPYRSGIRNERREFRQELPRGHGRQDLKD